MTGKYSFLLLLLTTIVILQKCECGDKVASLPDLSVMFDLEKNSVSEFSELVKREREKLEHVKRLRKELKDQTTNLGFYNDVDHPLNALRLIDRFVTTWSSTLSAVFNLSDYQALETKLSPQWKFYSVDEDDLKMGYRALLRLQEVYEIPADEISWGWIKEKKAVDTLDVVDCMNMAVLAAEKSRLTSALEWLEEVAGRVSSRNLGKKIMRKAAKLSMESFDPEKKKRVTTKTRDFIYTLADAIEMDANAEGDEEEEEEEEEEQEHEDQYEDMYARGETDEDDEEQYFDSEDGTIDTENIEKLVSKTVDEDMYDDYKGHDNFTALCRGEKLIPYDHSLKCRLVKSKLSYVPWKMETLLKVPEITLVHDFISPQNINKIGHIAYPKMGLAMAGGKVMKVRVGKVAWIYESNSTLVDSLSKYVEDVTGLATRSPAAEPWQVSTYGLAGHYSPHHDYVLNRDGVTSYSPTALENGDRIATFMVYLNSVKAGGSTVFPYLGVAVPPEQGAALMWYNYDEYGHPAKETIHAACPVLLGTKWVANKWIRQHGQEFRYPCPTVYNPRPVPDINYND